MNSKIGIRKSKISINYLSYLLKILTNSHIDFYAKGNMCFRAMLNITLIHIFIFND